MKKNKATEQDAVETCEAQQEMMSDTMSEEQNESASADAAAAEGTLTPEQEIEQLKAQLQEATDKVAELEDLKLRQMAEFDNYRRRTQKEKLELMDTAGEKIFVDMLSLVDDFDRAMQGLSGLDKTNDADYCKALADGVELIYQKFMGFLEQHKVTAIETENRPFSTDLHEAITTFAAGEDKKGQIIDCTQKGYKLGEKVIRFAKVVVGE